MSFTKHPGKPAKVLEVVGNIETPPANLPQAPEVVIEADIVEPEAYPSLHGMLQIWATTPGLLVEEDIILKNSELVGGDTVESVTVETVKRRLSVKERIECAKSAQDFFAPKLKSVDLNITSEFQNMTDEELLIYANSLISNQDVIEGDCSVK